MQRNLTTLSDEEFDVVIVGGGIYGVFAAWDAALRGLSVALVEKGDLGHATSWNTLRIIHGGLRYLQHADLRRMRQSIRERQVFLRIAPYLVRPIPFFIPTYGHALRGKAVLAVALSVNDVVSFDRNRLNDPPRRLPRSRVISRRECLRTFPRIESGGLTGAAIYYDCQMSSSERFVLSVARAASRAGAQLANYAEVVGFLGDGHRVSGVRVHDGISGTEFDVRGRTVLNTAGPWADTVLDLLPGDRKGPRVRLSKAFNLYVDRDLTGGYALGVYSKSRFKDRDALLDKGSRLFFLTPCGRGSMIGTVHQPHDDSPDACGVTEVEINTFLDDVNRAFPAADLKREDVRLAFSGLLPMKPNRSPSAEVQLVKHSQVRDHSVEDGVEGLVSVVGVKFTESRRVAERAIDLVTRKLGVSPSRSRTATLAVHGGEIERVDDFLADQIRRQSPRLDEGSVRHLVSRYGSAYDEVLESLDNGPPAQRPLEEAVLFEAEVRHAIRHEMAQKLEDVVFRRTALAAVGHPGDDRIASCARVMARELDWQESRTRREVEETQAAFGCRN